MADLDQLIVEQIQIGPMQNFAYLIGDKATREVVVVDPAWDIDGLHEDRNNIRKPTAVDENGNEIAGAGDSPNRHDILTGSNSAGNLPDGGFVPGGGPGFTTTCSNWTSGDAGNAIVGHHDRLGGPSASWNAVHSTRSCSQEDLESTGGDGLFYCFAAD